MIKPYYQDALATLFHGDCREILPKLGKFDLLLADVPYGIGYTHSGGGLINGKPCHQVQAKVAVVGDDQPFDPGHLLAYPNVVLWGANHYANKLPSRPGWLVWDKREATTTNSMSDCELAWTSSLGSARLFHHLWNGFAKASKSGLERVHPTQKPVALMQWCLRFFPDAKSVIDPYAGTCPVALACKLAGIRCVSIEIDETYCRIGAERLAQGVFDFAPHQETSP